MKPVWVAVGVIGSIFLALQALAQEGSALATAKGCMNCHAMDQKKIGPSFKDIAAKYAGNADAGPTIIAELKNGKGHPKVAASDADLKAMIDYVLAAK